MAFFEQPKPGIIRLLSGFELPIREGETAATTFLRHVGPSVTEGLCPACGSSLGEPPWPIDEAPCGGYCPACLTYWGYDPYETNTCYYYRPERRLSTFGPPW